MYKPIVNKRTAGLASLILGLIVLILFSAGKAGAQVTELVPSSADVSHEANGWPDLGVAIQVKGSGEFEIRSDTCWDYRVNVRKAIAPTTVYAFHFPHQDGYPVGQQGDCEIGIGGKTFTFHWTIRPGVFPPIYATNAKKIPERELPCTFAMDGDLYKNVCPSPDPRPGGNLTGWPSKIGDTFVDPVFGGVIKRISNVNVTQTYPTLRTISQDGYLLSLDLVSGSQGYIADLDGNRLLTLRLGNVNVQSCQWSANPDTPRVIWCETATAIRKYEAKGTPPNRVEDKGVVFTDNRGIYTGGTNQYSANDTFVYLDSKVSNAKDATQFCAVNLLNTAVKTCFPLKDVPDPSASGWNEVGILPSEDARGYRYAVLFHGGAGTGRYNRYFRWRDGDRTMELFANGATAPSSAPDGLATARWGPDCDPPWCVSSGHTAFAAFGGEQYIYSADPARSAPSYRAARALIRVSAGEKMSLRATDGGGLSYGSHSVDYASCVNQLCVSGGSLYQGSPKESCRITGIRAGQIFVATVGLDCQIRFRNDMNLLITGANGIKGVNGRVKVLAIPTPQQFIVNAEATGIYLEGGVVTVDEPWERENAQGNEIVVHRLDTGQVRRLAKPWAVPFSQSIYGAGGYWDATRVTISPDGRNVLFASNGGLPDNVAQYTIDTGFDLAPDTPRNMFDRNGNGMQLTVGSDFADVHITVPAEMSCRAEVSENSDLSAPAQVIEGMVPASGGLLAVPGLKPKTRYYARAVCGEDLVAVDIFETKEAEGGGPGPEASRPPQAGKKKK